MDAEQDAKRLRVGPPDSVSTGGTAGTEACFKQDILLERKRAVDNLFIEINKGLNYADAASHRMLIENQDFAYIHDRLQEAQDVTLCLKETLDEKSCELAIMHHNHSGATDTLAGKWRAAFLLRSAFLHASLRSVSSGRLNLRYYPALPNLEHTEELSPVVLRREDEYAWDCCLKLSFSRNVCCVGMPGIGKSTSTFYLLQKIVMQERKTLVYAVQAPPPKKTVYMKFVPIVENNSLVDITVVCKESKDGPEDAYSWSDGDYYVVDAGKATSSCDFDFEKDVHLVIVCSANDSHWGKNEFGKMRHRVRRGKSRSLGGTFVYHSPWKLQDVLDARHLLDVDLSDAEICFRYRVVGGSIRKIIDFLPLNEQQQGMKSALAKLKPERIQELADGTCENAFDPTAPGSALVSIEPGNRGQTGQAEPGKSDPDEAAKTGPGKSGQTEPDKSDPDEAAKNDSTEPANTDPTEPANTDQHDPTQSHLKICSDVAEEVIARKALKMSWFAVLDEANSGNRGNLFEAFVRNKLAGSFAWKMDRYSSPHLPTNPTTRKEKNYETSSVVFQLAKKRIQRVANLAKSVRAAWRDDILFYSKDEFQPLIDMIMRMPHGFLAIQATIQKRHDAAKAKICKLVNDLNLQQTEKLVIVYAVPESRLMEFETSPVNPLHPMQQDLVGKVEIFHAGISFGADESTVLENENNAKSPSPELFQTNGALAGTSHDLKVSRDQVSRLSLPNPQRSVGQQAL